MNPKMTVETNAPRKPSHVLLGDSLMRLVRPKKNPIPTSRGGVVRRQGEGSIVLTKEVSHDVIAYYHGDREQEPEWSLKDVLEDEVSL